MKSLNTIAKGAGFVFAGMILSKFLTYVYRVIVARIGTTEYGNLSLALAVFGITGIIALLGLNVGVVRFTSFYKAREQMSRVKGTFVSGMKISVSIAVILGIVLFVLAPNFGKLFHAPDIVLFIRLLAFMLPFYAARNLILAAVKAFTQKSSYEVLSQNVFESVIKVAVTAVLVFIGYKALGAVYAVLVGIGFTFLLALYYWKKFLPYSGASIENKKELLKYSLPLLLTSLLLQVLVWTDVLMLGLYTTTAEVGIYNAALPTATLMSIIPGGIIALFLPVMTELYAKDKIHELRETLKTCSKWIFFLNLPIFLVLIAFAAPLLSLIFGSDYAVGSFSLMILSIGYLIFQFFHPSAETLNVLNKTKLVFMNTVVAAFVNIVLNLLLIPKYGMVGGAIATAISYSVYGLFAGIEAWYYTKTFIIRPGFLKGIIAGGIAVVGALWVGKYVHFVLAIVVLLIVYSIVALLLRSLDEKDNAVLRTVKTKLWK